MTEDEARRVELVHQGIIVRRDNDRGAQPVELDEQAQQAVADDRIDVAGGLVGEQELGPPDHGTGDGRTLLLAAGQDFGVGVDAVAEADPAQAGRSRRRGNPIRACP